MGWGMTPGRWLLGLGLWGWMLTMTPATLIVPWLVAQAGFQTYRNARFGYRIAYPRDLMPQGESANGDGQVFIGKDGTTLRVWGGYNVLGETLTGAFQAELHRCREHRRQVTYRTLGPGFFVVSGYEADGARIFYLKKIVRPERQVGFELVYPAKQRRRYDREVTAMANSLRLLER
ncbi:hypothetical protein [Gloeomargarita sp.]